MIRMVLKEVGGRELNLYGYFLCFRTSCKYQLEFTRGNSLAVQWLGIGTLTAKSPGLIPGGGTKILQAA